MSLLPPGRLRLAPVLAVLLAIGPAFAAGPARAVERPPAGRAASVGRATRRPAPPAERRLRTWRGGRDRVRAVIHQASPGWRERGESLDVTDRFAPTYRTTASGGAVLPPDAPRYTYLLVGGAFSRKRAGKFTTTARHLQGLGLRVEISRINTADDVERNAAVIADEIEALTPGPDDQVILVTHSKGGPDALAADGMFHERLAGKVRGRLLIQPADGGAPHARLLDNPVGRRLLRMLGGAGGLYRDMTPAGRADLVARHPYSFDVPTVVIASSVRAPHPLRNPVGALVAAWRGPGDLVLPLWSQIVPGAHLVQLTGMTHLDPVIGRRTARYQPGPLAEAGLALLLSLKPD